MKPAAFATPTGSLVNIFGGRYYRITDVDRLPTFFMNVVSVSDQWLFLASNGGLTAGRVDADHALFPYQSVDRIYDSTRQIGPMTALWVGPAGSRTLWEPFSRRTAAHPGITRHLYKSIEGDRVWFEEVNATLGLVFRYGWSTAEEHGFIRHCEIENLGSAPRGVRLLDGLRNLLPPGIPQRLQSGSSCLADAYKTAELLPDSTLAVYALAAGIVDRAIPLESLRASIVWSEGLPGATTLISDSQLDQFYTDAPLAAEHQRRGVRCSYYLSTSLELAPGTTTRWLMVADLGLTQGEVAARRQALAAGPCAPGVDAAADAARRRLRQLVGAADGLQTTAVETTTVHHFANVLFNILRGGIFVHGHDMPGPDFTAFVHRRNRPVAKRHAALLAALPATLPRADLLARLVATGDPDLKRLGLEYLPLTFSRRHGDPSRPWNKFSIRLRDEHGRSLLAHEGNWRDIFQNWEALCLSHPEFFESIVAKFVNASTIDGYNPYRLSQAGLDWEVPDHEDPWASIGYWGDHQTIYLLKLLEWSGRFHPGRLEAWLRRDLFCYAAVPYRIAGYEALRRNPHATIDFDAAQHKATLERVAQMGTDARLLPEATSGVRHVNLTEKLLVLVLTRLTNFVPGGGIWMNTQRPEWNDANNALVGYGVSMVTLCYLRRMLVHLGRELMPALGDQPVPLTAALVTLANEVQAAFAAHQALLREPVISDAARRSLLDALATAGSHYRTQVYTGVAGPRAAYAPAALQQLLTSALAFVDHSIRANRQADGLYHSYNLLEFVEAPAAVRIHHLGPMLEGQVAVLSSGLLSAEEAADLLAALRRSALYRADQHSYLLYPDRALPGFLARNVLPADATRCPLLRDLLAAGDRRLVEKDAGGSVRFNADLANGEALEGALAKLAADPRWSTAVAAHATEVKAIYEGVFHHRAFTGRSGSMFGYEGLGCIYWHMVAKLLLATQENLLAAPAGSPAASRLAAHYYDIRAGLGFNKTPEVYGAFPTDPYSHTPGHSGAQQPGMTGQVKEEILTRLGELGVQIAAGQITFAPSFLLALEFTSADSQFPYIDANGEEAVQPLPAGAVAFSLCGIPVIYRRGAGPAAITVQERTGPARTSAGLALDAATSARIFARDGSIARLEVNLGPGFTGYTPPA
jgi:hypothetical protein